jgi:hypothetical protein
MLEHGLTRAFCGLRLKADTGEAVGGRRLKVWAMPSSSRQGMPRDEVAVGATG